MIRKFTKKRIKASITVEASLILPVVIAVIILIIVMTFIKSDKAVIQSIATISSKTISHKIINGESISDDDANSIVTGLLKRKLIIVKNLKVDCKVTKQYVDINITGISRVNNYYILNQILNKRWYDITAYSRSKIINCEEIIRKTKLIKEKIQGE